MVDHKIRKLNAIVDPESQLIGINFTSWKRNYIKSFLQYEQELVFIASINEASKNNFNAKPQFISWASKDQSEVNKIIEKWGGVAWYMEDGFIRSSGLGTDLTAPASLVLDKTGIYYDPSNPSDLESLLQNKQFTDDEMNRASELISSLLKNELSKYNLGREFKTSDLKDHNRY